MKSSETKLFTAQFVVADVIVEEYVNSATSLNHFTRQKMFLAICMKQGMRYSFFKVKFYEDSLLIRVQEYCMTKVL